MAALDSINERLLAGMATELLTLSLKNQAGADLPIISQTLLDVKGVPGYPFVAVTLDDTQEEEGESTFEAEEVITPLNVQVVDQGDTDWQAMRPYYLGWRDVIAHHLRSVVALTGVPELWDLQVKPQKIVEPVALSYGALVSGLWARCYTRRSRKSKG